MTKPNPRRIGILAFDGMQALDLVGPADAFASDAFRGPDGAGDLAALPYEIAVIGLGTKRCICSSGLVLQADVTAPTAIKLDTLIVPGGAGLRRPGVAERATEWIRATAPRVRRIASVCTGIYGLAPTGLLDGRRVATHWSAVRDVAKRFPALHVDADALFVKDGKFYTSAGISAGIDLALALIEEDLGPRAALAVARELVVYVKREGGQAQFSGPLSFQVQTLDRFGEIAAWIHANLHGDLSVEALASRANLSLRQFARVFRDELGDTPASFVEAARLEEAAKRLSISRRRANVEEIARSVGYASDDVFRRAFERKFGVAPRHYRRRFGGMQ